MFLSYFRPGDAYSMQDAERITGKLPGKAPWPIAGPVWLARNGFDVKVIFDFDYPAFATEGIEYIRHRYGDEVAKWQAEHGSGFGRGLLEEFLSIVTFEQRMPTLDDVSESLATGGLVTCAVNSKPLKDEDGYEGHYVVVYGADDERIHMHNPGPPPKAQQVVSVSEFDIAWSFPDKTARYVMLVNESGQS